MTCSGSARVRVAVAAIAGLLALSGCPGDDSSGDEMGATTVPMGDSSTGAPATGGDTPSHADIQPIWDAHCVEGCHEPSGTGVAWIDMTSGTAYGAIVGVAAFTYPALTLVTAGDVESSYLWHKINGTQASIGGGGLDMPAERTDMPLTVLTQDEYDMIEAWIAGGAPE